MANQNQPTRIRPDHLLEFCTRVFAHLDVPEDDAWISADVLVSANLRGVDSHGVARLKRYVAGLRSGQMLPRPQVQVVHETGGTALLDGGGGLGQPIGVRGMKLALEKAQQNGTGFVTVRNSNHFGIAGYYAMMALPHDMIGICLTNAALLAVPTFGRDVMLGTNPISVAAPAGQERPFVLDMATSVVPLGKLEVYERKGQPLLPGWAVDETGRVSTDTTRVLRNLAGLLGGGILPLGGEGEEFGGHKGYGLALMVDILSGVLPGAGYANTIYPKAPDGKPLPANVGHFFGALRIDAFRPAAEFRATMDDLIRRLKASPKAEGQERIYIHGEKEFEIEEVRRREGIPLDPKVVESLQGFAQEFHLPLDLF
ncbi:MAG: Ldh family oxidoreductase [Chloroflexi bacterium]|nr:Ldh family oxidoreductase [Chloroflexota bacterium]